MVTFCGILLLVGILLTHGATHGWVGAWQILDVPAAVPPFVDMHVIADDAACAARGIDVYRDTSCDVYGRGFNYPPVWLALGHLGIDGSDTVPLALVMDAAAAAVLVLLVRGRSIMVGLVVLAALASPSVAVGFERGNCDLSIFALVGAAALLLDRERRGRAAAAGVLLVGAIVLKLYPVATGISFARSRRWTLTIAAVAACSLAYGVLIWPMLPLIRGNTDEIGGVYGATAFFAVPIGARLGADLPPFARTLIGEGVATAVLLAAAVAAWRSVRRGVAAYDLGAGTTSAAFQFGAGIYCLTFMLGSNYAYRLVFLLLLLPQIFDWIESGIRLSRTAALTLLLLMLGAMWVTIGTDAQELASQALHWALFAGLAFVLWRDLIGSVPRLWSSEAL